MAGNKYVIVVCGPTGSGKTDLGIALARRFAAPVLSADSRQVFRGMAIGTAQPYDLQLAAIPHYMIANHDITERYTSGHYEREALDVLQGLFNEHDTVIAVGGSGLYIDALCHGLDSLPEADPGLREWLENEWVENRGKLLEQLLALDPGYYNKVDKANPQRVIRALEVCLTGGAPYSTLRQGMRQSRDFKVIKIGVSMPREELYARINSRVDRMMDDGLEAEARALYQHRDLNALQTVGYRELFEYLDGKRSRAEAVELIKRNSRRYAKRQMTWFGKDRQISWFTPDDVDAIEAFIRGAIAG